MSTKPGVFKLSGESYKFVRSNLDILVKHLAIVFPVALLLELVNQVGIAYDAKYIGAITLIPILVITGCFALSWHRTSLTEPSAAHAINPFRIKKEEFGFLCTFTGLILVTMIVIGLGVALGILLVSLAYKTMGMLVAAPVGILAAVGIIFVFVFLIRLTFILPARSVGFKLTIGDAERASKGLVWPVLGSSFIFSLLMGVFSMIYAFVVSLTVGMAIGPDKPVGIGGVALEFLISMPIYAASFLLMALNVTALSRAYQWGIQNNAYQKD